MDTTEPYMTKEEIEKIPVLTKELITTWEKICKRESESETPIRIHVGMNVIINFVYSLTINLVDRNTEEELTLDQLRTHPMAALMLKQFTDTLLHQDGEDLGEADE